MFVSLLEAQPPNHHYHSHKYARKNGMCSSTIQDIVVVRKSTKETHNWHMRRFEANFFLEENITCSCLTGLGLIKTVKEDPLGSGRLEMVEKTLLFFFCWATLLPGTFGERWFLIAGEELGFYRKENFTSLLARQCECRFRV